MQEVRKSARAQRKSGRPMLTFTTADFILETRFHACRMRSDCDFRECPGSWLTLLAGDREPTEICPPPDVTFTAVHLTRTHSRRVCGHYQETEES